MRTFLMGLTVVGFLAAGCSSSDNGDGGTTGTGGTGGGTVTGSSTGHATTSGSSTAGSTTATSTGGTTGSSTAGTTSGTTGGGGLAPGDACTANAQCASAVCGVNGTGHCCTATCDVSDFVCGAMACSNSGACVFPAGGPCGTNSCTGDMLTPQVCSGQGTCVSNAAVPCPNNFVCQDATSCKTSCTVPADCQSGFYCDTGTHACLAQLATGPCTDNSACASGVCGTNGTGNCCTASCATTDATCGATACDSSGACSYPDATTACGAQSCTGNTQTNATTCDGAGACSTPGTIDCTPFICGATACQTTCTDAATCVGGGFCDADFSACCSGLAARGTINVDGATGKDAACCGIGTNGACQTIGRAMKMIDAAQAKDVTINATVNGVGGDWTPAGEVYPIVLGWGVELNAPGVFFLDDIGFNGGIVNDEIFYIAPYSTSDTIGYASIVGAAGNSHVGIGMDVAGDQSLDYSSILIEASQTLYLANASVNGSANNFTVAISINAGGTLWFGQDQSAGVTGTVNIGNALNNPATDGFEGIFCATDYASLGCTIADLSLVGQSSVVIQGQEYLDMEIYDYSNIFLTSAPIIGAPPVAPGLTQCTGGKPDVSIYTAAFGGLGAAVLLSGPVTMTFNNGIVQCISGIGFDLEPSSPNNVRGGPTLKMDGTIVQNTDIGVHALAGSATLTNSTIRNNFRGVEQEHYDADDSDATIDLSGGGNTVVCSSNIESSAGATVEGVNVFNLSKSNLAADNVAWNTAAPDYFSCDDLTTTCTCLITTCSATPPFDNMDAVEDSTNLGGITTTGNTQSSVSCIN